MKNLFSTFVMLFAFLLISCDGNAQQTKKLPQQNGTQVIQFHSTHRCITCNSIEKLSKETLKEYPKISFKLYNVDEPKNEKIAEQFEGTGTSLFLYNPKTGKKKDLTEFAFSFAKNQPQKFKEGLKKELKNFK